MTAMKGLYASLKERWLRASRRRKAVFVATAAVLAATAPLAADASIASAIGNFIGHAVAWFFDLLVQLMGWIMLKEIAALLRIAQYSNFVSPGPTAVRFGWVVVRDLSNMFFILILLIIAFATILSYEEYNYRKLLPRLFIMAVVINFSKTITGLFIDFGQVVMLTFVNGFVQAAGGNFARGFQIDRMLSMRSDASGDAWSIALAMVLAFILITIADAVILVLLVMLLFRIVYLWVLIILSPVAFLASTFPPARKYYAQWWDDLRKYVVTGPMVAFFLWLALLSFQKAGEAGTNVATDSGFMGAQTAEAQAERLQGGRKLAGGPASEATRDDVFISFIVAIALLMAGLKVAIESGTAGAGFASQVKGGLKKYGMGALKWSGNRLKEAGLRGGRRAARAGIGALATLPSSIAGTRPARWIAGTRVGRGIGAAAQWTADQAGKLNRARVNRELAVTRRNEAAALRTQASSESDAGQRATLLAQAEQMDRQAKRADWRAKAWRGAANIAGVAGGIGLGFGLPGVAAIAAAPTVREAIMRGIRGVGKADRAKADKEVADYGKAMSLDEAKAIASGQKVGRDPQEQAAAFKKVMELDKNVDAATILAGRKLLENARVSQETINDYEKTAKEKHFTYFDKNGNADFKKEDEALAKGEVDVKSLSEQGLRKLVEKVSGMDASYFAAGGPGAGMPGLEREVKAVRDAILETARGRKVANEVLGTRLAEYDASFPAGHPSGTPQNERRATMAEMFVASGGSANESRAYDISNIGSFGSAIKRDDFKESIKGKNAAKVIMSLNIGSIGDVMGGTSPESANDATQLILDNLKKADLVKAAQDALKSGNAEMRDKISKLVQYIQSRGEVVKQAAETAERAAKAAGATDAAAKAAGEAAGRAAETRSASEQALARIIDKNRSFDAFKA